MAKELLTIGNLKTHFFTHEGVLPAVDGCQPGDQGRRNFGLGGRVRLWEESYFLVDYGIGAGNGRIVDGEILFEGEDISKKTPEEMSKIRGNKITMIF